MKGTRPLTTEEIIAVSNQFSVRCVWLSTVKNRLSTTPSPGRQAITELIQWHKEQYGNLDPRRPLFMSRQGGEALSRSHAHRILERAFQKAGLNGKLATHSLRKTFAQRCYDACGDIHQVSELLLHQKMSRTTSTSLQP